MVLIDHKINGIDMVISLELNITRRLSFNFPPHIMISMPMIFDTNIVIAGVNVVHC